MLIAGYSHGALILRYVIRDLPLDVRASIVRVDLVGDPTADRSADNSLQFVASLGGRRTDGIDTWAKRAVWGRDYYFKQPAYPADVAPKTFQYCVRQDYICDSTASYFAVASRKAHARYAWQRIGRSAAQALP